MREYNSLSKILMKISKYYVQVLNILTAISKSFISTESSKIKISDKEIVIPSFKYLFDKILEIENKLNLLLFKTGVNIKNLDDKDNVSSNVKLDILRYENLKSNELKYKRLHFLYENEDVLSDNVDFKVDDVDTGYESTIKVERLCLDIINDDYDEIFINNSESIMEYFVPVKRISSEYIGNYYFKVSYDDVIDDHLVFYIGNRVGEIAIGMYIVDKETSNIYRVKDIILENNEGYKVVVEIIRIYGTLKDEFEALLYPSLVYSVNYNLPLSLRKKYNLFKVYFLENNYIYILVEISDNIIKKFKEEDKFNKYYTTNIIDNVKKGIELNLDLDKIVYICLPVSGNIDESDFISLNKLIEEKNSILENKDSISEDKVNRLKEIINTINSSIDKVKYFDILNTFQYYYLLRLNPILNQFPYVPYKILYRYKYNVKNEISLKWFIGTLDEKYTNEKDLSIVIPTYSYVDVTLQLKFQYLNNNELYETSWSNPIVLKFQVSSLNKFNWLYNMLLEFNFSNIEKKYIIYLENMLNLIKNYSILNQNYLDLVNTINSIIQKGNIPGVSPINIDQVKYFVPDLIPTYNVFNERIITKLAESSDGVYNYYAIYGFDGRHWIILLNIVGVQPFDNNFISNSKNNCNRKWLLSDTQQPLVEDISDDIYYYVPYDKNCNYSTTYVQQYRYVGLRGKCKDVETAYDFIILAPTTYDYVSIINILCGYIQSFGIKLLGNE